MISTSSEDHYGMKLTCLILPLDGLSSFKMAIYNITLDSFLLSFYITYDVKLAMNVMNGRQQ